RCVAGPAAGPAERPVQPGRPLPVIHPDRQRARAARRRIGESGRDLGRLADPENDARLAGAQVALVAVPALADLVADLGCRRCEPAAYLAGHRVVFRVGGRPPDGLPGTRFLTHGSILARAAARRAGQGAGDTAGT